MCSGVRGWIGGLEEMSKARGFVDMSRVGVITR